MKALQSSIESLFTERDALLSELNEWRQCLCMPPRQASMRKDHLAPQSHLLAQPDGSETNSMLVSEENTIGAAWPSELQLTDHNTLTPSCDQRHNVITNGVVNAPGSDINRLQPSAMLQPIPCLGARSDPSTMGCSMQFNETGPAPYGSIAHPTESGNHDFYSAATNHLRPPD